MLPMHGSGPTCHVSLSTSAADQAIYLVCGVPQGSVLDQFCLFSTPLASSHWLKDTVCHRSVTENFSVDLWVHGCYRQLDEVQQSRAERRQNGSFVEDDWSATTSTLQLHNVDRRHSCFRVVVRPWPRNTYWGRIVIRTPVRQTFRRSFAVIRQLRQIRRSVHSQLSSRYWSLLVYKGSTDTSSHAPAFHNAGVGDDAGEAAPGEWFVCGVYMSAWRF